MVTDVADIRSLSGSFDNNVPLTITSCSVHRPVRAKRRLSPAAHATIKKGITTSSGFACRRTFWLVMIPIMTRFRVWFVITGPSHWTDAGNS